MRWKDKLVDEFQTGKFQQYYTTHQILCDLYDGDVKIRDTIENMVQMDAALPNLQSYAFALGNGTYMVKRPEDLGLASTSSVTTDLDSRGLVDLVTW